MIDLLGRKAVLAIPAAAGLLLLVVPCSPVRAETVGTCKFDKDNLRFEGAPIEQAECLLRAVAIHGKVSPFGASLPRSLSSVIGTPTSGLKSSLERYLAAAGLDSRTLGGPLDGPVSHGRDGSAGAPLAFYFVIHDTSAPWLGNAAAFPTDDAPQLNRLSGFAGPQAAAHVFVNRVGDTLTGHDFSVPWRATKLESQIVGLPAKGVFLHVEFLQPRRRSPGGPPKNDAIAPKPGLTTAQYGKLALLYAMASARSGTWLVPAFHAAIDEGLSDAHDDPQNFDMAAFGAAFSELQTALKNPSSVPTTPARNVGAIISAPPTETAEGGALCARLQHVDASLARGTELEASGTGRTYKELFDACDATDKFDGGPLPMHDGKGVRCSSDKNRVAYIRKFPDGTIAFSAKMAVDADGSPVVGGSGWPNNVQTWLTFDPGSTLPFADAEEVPYVVVPGSKPGGGPSFQRDAGIGRGDLAVAIVGGRCSFGVVGDSGPWFRIGEASLRVHEEVGNPQCAVAEQHPCKRLKSGGGIGVGQGATYLVFAGTCPHPLLSQTVRQVAAAGAAARAGAFLRAEGR